MLTKIQAFDIYWGNERHIKNLEIETTRRCQLECAHCLRGDAEDMIMKEEYMDELLAEVTSIGTVTFTGGEPFLNPECMVDFMYTCKRNGIEVENFYIATNGLIFEETNALSELGLITVMQLYSFITDGEMSMVQISSDDFHYESISNDNLLWAFSFTSKKGNLAWQDCISEGRAEGCSDRVMDNAIDWEYPEDAMVYLNCEGKVVWNCDLSYSSQRIEGIGIKEAVCLLNQINEAQLEEAA